MLVKTLVENTAVSPEFGKKHGLCFYLETGNHKILFDLGPNDLFLENARKMAVDIAAVDLVVISHGHYDHGGALSLFLQHNHTAKVYVHENAFAGHYAKALGFYRAIGLDASLQSHPQIVLTRGQTRLDDALFLFADVTERILYSEANRVLYAAQNGKKVLDDFSHEQHLVVSEGDRRILLAGCAHAGIVAIKNRAEALAGGALTHVLGGFHLYNPTTGKSESEARIKAVAARLAAGETQYYTCHCTGHKAFSILQETLGDRIAYLSAGSALRL